MVNSHKLSLYIFDTFNECEVKKITQNRRGTTEKYLSITIISIKTRY